MFLEDRLWDLCHRRLRELGRIRQELEDMLLDRKDRRVSFLLDDVRRMEEDARSELAGERARWERKELSSDS